MANSKQKITISVVGARDLGAEEESLAYEVGRLIAQLKAVTVCGGLMGVMRAVAKGAKKEGGLTIGILPGTEKKDANPYIDIALPTSIGYSRNIIIACSADIVVALPGSYGTESEICYALIYNRPVIDLGGWKIKGMIQVKDLKDLKSKLSKLIQKIQADRKLKEE